MPNEVRPLTRLALMVPPFWPALMPATFASPYTREIGLSTISTEPRVRMPWLKTEPGEPPVSNTWLSRTIEPSPDTAMPMRVLALNRLFSIRWPLLMATMGSLSTITMPYRKPRTLPLRAHR
jgi:hypothetical protein